ncbi:MAG: DUF642 domain-containing protein [Luteolibacter sp.]
MFAAFSCDTARAWTSLQVHPQNPYILKFRDQPTVLRTLGEHYSSVLNTDFDYMPYLNILQRDGMNLTRAFLVGFCLSKDDLPLINSPLLPTPAQFLQPWVRTTTAGMALDGLGKWDLSVWNEDYFARLNAFAQACSDRGIVAELSLFCTFYTENQWRASPFNPSNNIQGYGPANRFDAMRMVNANLLAAQEAVVRRIVTEVNRFDNIYFEIQNEPFWNEPEVKDDQEVAFHNRMLDIIRATEAGLSNQHLVAHDFPQQSDALSSGFDVINEHYPAVVPATPIAGAENLLRDQYSRGRILGLDETDNKSAQQTRLESWMFILGGGGIYNGSDVRYFIYSAADETGDNQLGRDSRQAIRNIGTYVGNLDMVALRRDFSWITGGIDVEASVQAMASPGQQYVAYLYHGKSSLANFQLSYAPIDASDHTAAPVVTLDSGSWRVVWTRPSDLVVLKSEEFTHVGGSRTLEPLTYQEDVALRIDRIGAGDATPPPSPTGLVPVPNANGAIFLTWNPVDAADLAFYQLYRSESFGVPIDAAHRIATLAEPNASFLDNSSVPGTTYYYLVTALDLNGNESAASQETTATSILKNLPYGGIPWSVPGTIQAEDFDIGGQGLAYNDLTIENEGGKYRLTESVDIESTNDAGNGYHVSETNAGEWMKYTIHVATAGEFIPLLRIANPDAGGQVSLEVDGSDVSGLIAVPGTDSLANWQTLNLPMVNLSVGDHVLRLVMVTSAPGGIVGVFNWISFAAVPRVGPMAKAGPDQEVIDQDSNGFEDITLDASASVAGTSPITSFVWTEAGVPLANGSSSTVRLAVGSHLIRLVVTDGNNLQDFDEIAVKVTPAGFLNGSFESGFAGWAASGNQSIQSARPYAATEGSKLVAFNSGNTTPNGRLSQTFATIPGQTYLVSFDMGVLSYNTNGQHLQMEVTGSATLFSQIYPITGLGGGAIRWLSKSISFMANSTTSALTFWDRSQTTLALDLLLDNVKVTPQTPRILAVQSGPVAGVGVSPPDSNGLASGVTSFTRNYQAGTVVVLTASAGSGGLLFQKWLKDGVDFSTNLMTSVTMETDHTLTAVYVESAPVIISQPVGVTTGLSGSATFRVTATGTEPLSYQWRFDRTNITGAVADSYTISNVRAEDVGAYDVLVSNASGSITSNQAILAVLSTTLANGSFESGFTGWTVSGNQFIQSAPPYAATDGTRVVAFNSGQTTPNGVLSQSFTTNPGQTYLLLFDMGVLAYNSNEQRLQVDVSGSSVLLSQTFPITGLGSGVIRWLAKSLSFTANSTVTTLTFQDRSQTTQSLDLLLDNIRVTPRITRNLVVESSPVTGAGVKVSPPDDNGLADGSTSFSRSYPNFSIVTLTAPAGASGYRFQKWLKNAADFSNSPSISVSMDANATMTAVYLAVAPSINVQPTSLTTGLGGNATFRVTAAGTGLLSYQWRFEGAAINGAVADTYALNNVRADQAGHYDVVVSNTVGPVTSDTATLTVLATALVNGSFESGYTGWTASGNQEIQSAAPYVATDGIKLVVFNSANRPATGVLAQTFATSPGVVYQLSFDLGVLSFNTNEQRMQVDLTGNATLVSQTFSLLGFSGGSKRWDAKSFNFTADSSTTTLTFRDRSPKTDALDLLLDNVRVQGPPVPLAAAGPRATSVVLSPAISIAAPQKIALPMQPSISAIPGALRIHMSVLEPGVYKLERSRDLKTWIPVSEISSLGSDLIEFNDPDPHEEKMFYRIALPRVELTK